MKHSFIIASRSSPLAIWQALFFQKQIEQMGYAVSLETIVTEGDEFSLKYIFDTGHISQKDSFIKGVQKYLENRKAHFAVHSLKDLPLQIHQRIIALSPRETPQDTLILKSSHTHHINSLESFQRNWQKLSLHIGTNSPRRRDYLKAWLGQDYTKPLRGNVQTRLQRLEEIPDLGAIIIAQAALNRLGLKLENSFPLPFHIAPHAAGQGIMALECREDCLDPRWLALKTPICDWWTSIERSILIALQGSCITSVGFNWINETFLDVTYQATPQSPRRQCSVQIPTDLYTYTREISLKYYTFQVWDTIHEHTLWKGILYDTILPQLGHS